MKRLLIGFALGSLVLTGFAQVTQPAVGVPAATKTQTSATTSGVLTLTPDPNQSIYVYEIDVQNCVGASVVTAAAVTTITTTNLDGALAFTVGSGVAAGLCQPVQTAIYPTGLKAQTSTLPVTITLPAFATNQTIRVSAIYRSGP